MTRSAIGLPLVACLGLLTAGCSTFGQPKVQPQVAPPVQQGAAIDPDIQQILVAGGIDMAPAPAPDSMAVAAALQTPPTPVDPGPAAPSGFLPPPPPDTFTGAQATVVPVSMAGPAVITSMDDVPVGVLPDNVSIIGHDLTVPMDMTLPSYSFEGNVAAVRPSGILPPAPPVTQTIVLTGPEADTAVASARPVARSGPPVPAAMPANIRQARAAARPAAPSWRSPAAVAPLVNSDRPLAPVVRF